MQERRVKVAIVDDDPSVRKALCRLFGQLNMDAKSFSGGSEFIESFKRSAPDFLVLDLRMPKVSGWGVLSELRKMQANIKTIVISADDELTMDPRDGVVFLPKPVDEKSLLAALAQIANPMQVAVGQ